MQVIVYQGLCEGFLMALKDVYRAVGRLIIVAVTLDLLGY